MSTVTPPFVQNGCLFLDDQSPCGPEYYGYPVATSSVAAVTWTDYDSFVTALKARVEESSVITSFKSAYSCSSTNAFDLVDAINAMRYQYSYQCATIIANSINSGICSPLPVSGTQLHPVGPLVCQSSCDLAVASYSSIILNSDVCTNQTITASKVTAYSTSCNNTASYISKNDGFCSEGVSGTYDEKNNCGFRSKDIALKHCPTLKDSCCVAFTAKNVVASTSSSSSSSVRAAASSSSVSSASPAATSGGVSSGGSSGVNMSTIIPIVVVVGALIIVALISAVIYSKRRRQPPSQMDLKPYQYGTGTNLKDDSKPGFTNFNNGGTSPQAQASKSGFGIVQPQGFGANNNFSGANSFGNGSNNPQYGGMNAVTTDYSQYGASRGFASQPPSAHSGFSQTTLPLQAYNPVQQGYSPSTSQSYSGQPAQSSPPPQTYGSAYSQPTSPQQYGQQQQQQQQQYTPQTSASSTRSLNNPSASQFNVSATAASAPIPSYESLVASGATSAPARRSSIEKRPLNSASSATNSISYAGQPQRLNINGMPAGTASGVPPSPAPSGSIAPSISSSTASAPLVMRVLHPYAPTLNDELELVVGQEVIVLRAFDDGWGLGTTPSNGAQGAFPLVCVTSGVGSETGSVVSDALSSLAPEDREKQYRLSAMIQKGAKRESSIVR